MQKSNTENRPKDGASRQAEWKAGQRRQGRRRMELWLTDDERQKVDEFVKSIRETRMGKWAIQPFEAAESL